MFCSKCGKEISKDSVFCEFCGNKIETLSEHANAVVEKKSENNEVKKTIEGVKKKQDEVLQKAKDRLLTNE